MIASTTGTPPAVALLEQRFEIDFGRLEVLARNLAQTLHRARNLGMEYASPDDLNTEWRNHWNQFEGTLHSNSLREEGLEGTIRSNQPGHLAPALAAWEFIQSADEKLLSTLRQLRAQAMQMNSKAQLDWTQVERQWEVHARTIAACARALRIKLKWLQTHPKGTAIAPARDLVLGEASSSDCPSSEARDYAVQYQLAVNELAGERQEYFGIPSDLKTLFMWMETPEERVIENASLRSTSP